MGRKSRSKHVAKPPAISAYSNKKEMDRLVQKLLNTCVKPTTRKDEWENYLEIQFLVERIRQYQNSKPFSGNREEKLPLFVDWLKLNGVNMQDIVLENYGGEYGIGVKAAKDIKMDDEILQVPYKLMLTSEKAEESYLVDLIKSRKMLIEMPNISLALYLHCERLNPESFYKPYIDVLPKEYNTTLYFSPNEMEALKGTSAFSTAISQYKSIARQYGMFFNLMHGGTAMPEVEKIPLTAKNEFTYDAYRWAVASVSTRLNRIAILTKEEKQELCKHGGSCHDHHAKDSTLALIPMWDMINHSLGQISTDCDPTLKVCKSYAMQDFKSGEQIKIFYGARSNVGFLVYNGFVVENNPYDRVDIQLGVSSNDKLYKKRVQLLERLRIHSRGSFHIFAMVENLPTSPELLAFLRVFHMNEEELDSWYEKDLFGANGLKDIYMPNTRPIEADLKCWKYLENRAELLVRGFKKTEVEEEIFSNPEVSERMKLAIRMQRETRRVLESCQEFCCNFALDGPFREKLLGSSMPDYGTLATSVAPPTEEEGCERDTDADIQLLSKVTAENMISEKNLTETDLKKNEISNQTEEINLPIPAVN
uniref:actin-histidine N-methyltransferase-like n=1 Tax=Styela clava TaxID=7725 RepID=UPI001939EE4C|nr:actin-histidine N-methyltransferase-like [Styela clava]